MKSFHIASAAEQVASFLKEQIARREVTGFAPGGAVLARQLGIGRTTADEALELLESEGIIESQGIRRRRKIVAPTISSGKSPKSVGLILYEPQDAGIPSVAEVRLQLLAAGFHLALAPKTLVDLHHDPQRIQKMVEKHPADAWVIQAGSLPVLRWFAESSLPAFALYGQMQGLNIPGIKPDKRPAMRKALNTLAVLGHRRIVLLVREERRVPCLGNFETAFLAELDALGIPHSSYNIPDWHESSVGLRQCLEKLLQFTPPTAIFLGDAVLFLAVQHILRASSNRDAHKIALICTDHHSHFDWCDPAVPHFAWSHHSTARQIVKWLKNLGRGRQSCQQILAATEFIEGNLRDYVLPRTR